MNEFSGNTHYDGALYIHGSSMYPRLMEGDMILYKIVLNREKSLFFGHIYLVAFEIDDAEYIMVRYIHQSEIPGHIKLVSHNQEYPSRDLPIDCIHTIAIVKTSIRHETFK